MKTKIVTLALLILSPFALLAEPPELSNLRESWNKAREQATAPLDRKYVTALENMKVTYTRNGNLEGANAIDKELSKVLPDVNRGASFQSSDDRINQGNTRRALLQTSWLYKSGEGEWHISFTGRGVCTWENLANKFTTSGPWEIEKGGEISLVFPGEKIKRVVQFNNDHSAGIVTVKDHPIKGGTFMKK